MQSEPFKKNTLTFDLYEGEFETTIKQISTPVSCVIVKNKLDISKLKLIPLLPNGSIWIYVRDTRNKDGSLQLIPEKLMMELNESFHIADKVVCECEVKRGIERRDKNYLASSMVVLRFTVCQPNESWTTRSLTNSVWERTIEEDHSWYSKQIKYTCPPDGIVLDTFCDNGYVAEAALRLGIQFIGMGLDVKAAKKHINSIAARVS